MVDIIWIGRELRNIPLVNFEVCVSLENLGYITMELPSAKPID